MIKTSKTIKHIVSLLNSLILADYKKFNKYSEWRTKVKVPKYLEEKLLSIPDHLTMYQLLMRIRRILFDLYGEKRDYAKSFADSRFTPLPQMLKRGMISCGALTAIYGTILRNYNIPTKWMHGRLSSQKKDDAHAWLKIYDPKEKQWIDIDPNMADFEKHPQALEYKIYHNWNELKKDYEKGLIFSN